MSQGNKVLVAQGGGPTAVINQTLAGIVLEARKFPPIAKIYGAVRGVEGIVSEDFLDLTQETTHNLEQIALTPSAALRSTRLKPDSAYCHEIFKVLKAHAIRYFFYIGGNDAADTVRIVNEEAAAADYDLRAIHVPMTIDNDLAANDHTPGYGSAARFVAQAFMGVNLDVRSLPGVYIGVVMGRNAGFLAAASAIAQKYPDDGPHLIYLPERAFSLESFLGDVKRIYDRHGTCVAAVAEGLQNAGTGALGDLLAEAVKARLGIFRVRSDTFGYLQRSFFGCVSDVDQHEAREVGERAVQMAVWQNKNGSVAIHRTGYYSVDYRLTDLATVAGQTRQMPDEFISAAGNHITDAFKFYVRPLLGSGLQSPAQLRAPAVPKILR